ncbi:MAG TPA: universal stress protein [Chthoniobacterales bacterium]|jgi:nucleotide-binding universal stress UspA family protein|nr:universal stress protein [Chthoniobacterales bacterium]
MKILICSDGTPAADNAARLGGVFAGALQAETTLLGIAEKSAHEPALREALEKQAHWLREKNVSPEIVMHAGDPVRQIVNQTTRAKYDLVIVGARKTGSTGLHWRSEKTYEVIKSIEPPVLVAVGEWAQMKQFLVCTGGKEFIEGAIQLTGKLASAVGAAVTLLHVMAEPPAIYADLVRLEEDVDRLLESNSELCINLRTQKEDLEKMGVPTEICIRHGIVIDQVFAQARANNYDLIVTGSSRARGMVRHYIMGDLTRSILNHASCPVLVTRAATASGPRGFWRSIRRAFATTPSTPPPA